MRGKIATGEKVLRFPESVCQDPALLDGVVHRMQLDSENVKRQEEEAEILAQAKKIVTTDPEVGARSILVVAGEGWHRGVIGIVASKLQDAFHRPAIVLSVEDGIAHGSCRSFSRFDMLGALGSAATSRPPASRWTRPGFANCVLPSTRSPTRRSAPTI